MVRRVETCDNCGVPMDTKQEDEKFFLAICGSCGRNHFEVTEDALQEGGLKYEVAAKKPFEDGNWIRVAE